MVILRPIPGPDLERAGEAGWLRCTPGLFDSVVITGDIRGMNLWIDNVRVAVSPEPGAVLLVASGLLAIGGMARRRRA